MKLFNGLKLLFRYQLINVIKINFKDTYFMIIASYEAICVEFWRKNNTSLVNLLLNCRQVLNIF